MFSIKNYFLSCKKFINYGKSEFKEYVYIENWYFEFDFVLIKILPQNYRNVFVAVIFSKLVFSFVPSTDNMHVKIVIDLANQNFIGSRS